MKQMTTYIQEKTQLITMEMQVHINNGILNSKASSSSSIFWSDWGIQEKQGYYKIGFLSTNA